MRKRFEWNFHTTLFSKMESMIVSFSLLVGERGKEISSWEGRGGVKSQRETLVK